MGSLCVWLLLHVHLGAPALAAGGIVLELQQVAAGLSRPLIIAAPGDGSGRLLLGLQSGRILVWDGAAVLATPFLDVSSIVSCCGEQGLLGLAFHPRYEDNGSFYVNYTDPAGDTVVARFEVSASDPNRADPDSGRELLAFDQPFTNHNGGQLAFGPDGYLYIASGDGGSGGDPQGNAQSLESLLGKILRIDVDRQDPGLEYAIPPANPLVGQSNAREEIWAWGLRNPWRFSFDRITGDLLIGDVGQNALEEIDFQPAASPAGRNYGWDRMEGSSCFEPPSGCDSGGLVLPVLEYDHSLGCSVIGGFRYRGQAWPKLRGIYLYADHCAGTVWGTVPRCDGVWEPQVVLDAGFRISSFGEDEAGELYLAEYGATNGKVHRIGVAGSATGQTLQTSPTVVDFGSVTAGSGDTEIVWLSNQNPGPGSEALLVESITSPASTAFSLDLEAGPRPCGATPCLGPAESCSLEVSFHPMAPGTYATRLEIAANHPTVEVPVSGAGGGSCEPLIQLANGSVSDTEILEACETAVVGPSFVVSGEGDLTLRAGLRVELRNGFRVEAGGRFAAEVDPGLAGPSP